ncbi:septation protein imp2 [Verticillium alfalfae VaMs.102]|uniref:Septation protein imp2 n=1 Tax=Verticillium alfalfae (strain VaMs.102 / ATCC MYA-4576 / FGSC 10136) TaxID=526221 RepID=C9SWP3_VERA1|nr:septation protein imp2 [Verticillium alfalfae VaMs.102]EEY23208.1 septation protein imp2 [Verticillium alfalfae VaMs.102]
MGSLRTSLDTLRGEVEAMAKQHQNNAAQMKSELEEPLGAFAGGMKERRKIVQNGIEKLLKTKIQQTQHVNKTRDRYEQECLKIKGYLAQGHMVMGQEERPPSERSSHPASVRPSSRDSHSEYSYPTSLSSQEPPSGKASPTKQEQVPLEAATERRVFKKRSGFFQNHSPFRRKSTKEAAQSSSGRNTWHSASHGGQSSPNRRPQIYSKETSTLLSDRATNSPEPIDANASLPLNVGQNVFSVTTPDMEKRMANKPKATPEEIDPIALALAELKGVGADKQATVRVSADRYHGIATPAPAPSSQQSFARSVPPLASNSAATAGLRGTPPPSYDQQVQRLGVPPAAVTARAMKETSQKFTEQARSVFGSDSRPGSSGFAGNSTARTTTRGREVPRAMSPAPPRSVSPRPDMSSSASGSRLLPTRLSKRCGKISVPRHRFCEYTRSNSGPAQVTCPSMASASEMRTMNHIEVGNEAGRGQAPAIVLWGFTMEEDPRKAVRVSEVRVLLILRDSTLEMAVPFFTSRGQCTKMMVGGKQKYMAVMDVLALYLATTSKPAERLQMAGN